MRKAKEIIGLPVLTFRTGRKVVNVRDILFDPAQNRVLALLVDEGGWFDSAKVIPFDRLKSIGRDAVVIEDERAVVPASSNRAIHDALHKDRVITKMHVFTEDGRDIGSIGDMWIDEESGEVKGFEVTGGLVSDTLRGKGFLPAPKTLSMGRDVTFIPPEAGDKIEEEPTGGVQKGLSEAQARTGETLAQGQRAVGQAGREVQARGGEAFRASTDQQKNFVVGKVARTTVRTPDDNIIVRKGDKITRSDADAADQAGMLGPLVSAVGISQAEELGTRAQQGAGQVFDDIANTFSGFGRNIQQQNETQRIQSAIGRPTTRVILDKNDHVILNVGEIITHEAVRRARDADELNVLLSSVSTKPPELTTEQRHAPVPGEASLHKRSAEKENKKKD